MIGNVRALCLVLLVQTILPGATRIATTEDVVRTVYDSLYSDRDDALLAQELLSLKLREQLSPHIVTYFRNIGLGSETVAALQQLQQRSSALRPAIEPALEIQPVPKPDEQREMMNSVARYAVGYVGRLPNFLCTQVTDRYTNLRKARVPC